MDQRNAPTPDREISALREILQVISRSRDDEAPVFDAILKNAQTLCNAPISGLILGGAEDARQTLAAQRGMLPQTVDMFETGQMRMDRDLSYAARAIIDGALIAFPDMGESDLYAAGSAVVRAMVDQSNIRSVLFTPLMRSGVAIGAITVFRKGVDPFDDTEIALVETFAAQAVIAIENVRQFREVQARLEREQASREILQVISRSRDDEAPVFDAILSRAATLCNPMGAALLLIDDAGTALKMRASWGALGNGVAFDGLQLDVAGDSLAADAVRSCASRTVDDLTKEDSYLKGDTVTRRFADETGVRSILSVPLLLNGAAVGCIDMFRQEARAFQDRDIALVETFAAQAVIAIENVRQFKALEARTEEVQALNASLEARVETQVGEIERMGRLKRFLSPAVADAVISAGDEALLQSHRAMIATLFADMRGFTAFCETAEPEETIEVLQTFHEEMGVLIRAHAAGVDTRSGDGLMVIMGDPLPCDDPAGAALDLALAMRARMTELCQRWKRMGHRLGFGVGLSLGYATVGLVGSEGRYDYTANGATVNLAARLCDHARDGEILLSPRAYMALEDRIAADSLGDQSFKGIKAPVEVFRVAAGV